MTATPEQLAAAWSEIRLWLSESATGRLLGAHLAARYSSDGRLETALTGDPTLDVAAWLADGNLDLPSTTRHLLAALLVGFAAAEARLLAGAATEAEVDDLAGELWHRSELEMSEVLGVRVEYEPFAADADPIAVLVRLAVLAGATLAGHRSAAPRRLAGSIADMLVLERDVRDLIPSLRARRLNRAARLLADRSAIELDDDGAFQMLLGMVALGQGRQAILEPWKEALDAASALAGEFDSPELNEWIGELSSRYETVRVGDGSLVAGVAHLVPFPSFGRREQLARPALDLALHMAEGFLLADPDLAESWEVHRRGFLGHDVVVASFPAGLVLEVLARHGLDVSDGIARYLDRLAAQDFTYYDAAEFIWVETDTVGTVLRLLVHLEDREPWATLIESWEAQVAGVMKTTGAVPVWLIDGAEAVARSGMVLLGEGCGAIQARLMAAMCDRDPTAVPSGVVDDLLGRVLSHGLSIAVNYPPLFAAGAIRELLAAAKGSVSEESLVAAAGVLRQELESWAASDHTPMEAALLVAACVDSPDEDLIDRRFVQEILDAQDPDGGWPAEPLFFVPNKGGSVTWHRSRLLTAAFCFDALARWSRGYGRSQNPG